MSGYQAGLFGAQGAGERLRPYDERIEREATDLTRQVPRVGAGLGGGVMDLRCARCGGPWDLDYVVVESPEEFTRNGSTITRCPACETTADADLTSGQRDRAEVAGVLGDLLADDLDGAAAMLEDAELMGL